MFRKLKSKSEGFTIIEVLIVLAIAGLIMLIVFLAVPALQRNARNTTIKSDAAALAGGFSEYLSNNDGVLPASITQSGASVTIGAIGSSQAVAKVNGSTVVILPKTTPGAYATNTLYWNTGQTCDSPPTPNPRAITVYYYPESTGTPPTAPKCVAAG